MTAASVQLRLFEQARFSGLIATDALVDAALAAGAHVEFNMSGGKDSTAAAWVASRHLDAIGHPVDRRGAIHADLGRAEWQTTPETVERQAARLALPLTVVRRRAGDMVSRWEGRGREGLRRYCALETYNLIGPWSSPDLRFCTSELKAQVIGPHLARVHRGETIVQVVGIRREESTRRRSTPISKPDHRYAKPGNRAGTTMLLWHPLVDWSTEQVFDLHEREDLPLHESYARYGCSRLSCAFCIMSKRADLIAASKAASNVPLYLHLVGVEAETAFSFQAGQWLADIAPALLSPALRVQIASAQRRAEERRAIEAAMPDGLRYVKGWPVRVPTHEEAKAIVDARGRVLALYKLLDEYCTPARVIDRFAELMAMRDRRAAA